MWKTENLKTLTLLNAVVLLVKWLAARLPGLYSQQGFFCLSQCPDQIWGLPNSNQWVPGSPSQRVKQPDLEADSSAKVNNEIWNSYGGEGVCCDAT